MVRPPEIFRRALLLATLLAGLAGRAGSVPWARADPGAGVLRYEFEDIAAWTPWVFPAVSEHTRYGVTTIDGVSALRIAADRSASGLLAREAIDIAPGRDIRLRWRWRVDRIPSSSDPRTKPGDDHPLRIYVIFEQPAAQAGWIDRWLARDAPFREHGFLPLRTLEYVWTRTPGLPDYFASPYTDRFYMLPRRDPAGQTGRWSEVEAAPLADYERIFGRAPPRRIRLALMGDADDSQSNALAWLDWLEVDLSAGDPRQEESPAP